MAGFTFKLELRDGTPADPPVLGTAVPNWQAGDTIPLGAGRILRVVGVRPSEELDQEDVLVIEPVATTSPSKEEGESDD